MMLHMLGNGESSKDWGIGHRKAKGTAVNIERRAVDYQRPGQMQADWPRPSSR